MKTLGMAGLVALPVVCCAGLPLLLAAGVSVGLAAWIGGIVVGGIVLFGAAALVDLRVRRRAREQFLSVPAERSRT